MVNKKQSNRQFTRIVDDLLSLANGDINAVYIFQQMVDLSIGSTVDFNVSHPKMKKLGLKKDKVRRAIQRLTEWGWIEYECTKSYGIKVYRIHHPIKQKSKPKPEKDEGTITTTGAPVFDTQNMTQLDMIKHGYVKTLSGEIVKKK